MSTHWCACSTAGESIGETVEGLARFPINVRYPRDLRDSPEALRQLPVLTPGDFAVIRRKARICGISSVAELLGVLMEECALKEDGQKRGIGFV